MSVYMSAGIYAKEIDFSEYVKSIASFNVGMVAITDRGLEGKEGATVPIGSWEEFKLKAGSFRSDSYGAYAAKSFFDNKGGTLFLSRVLDVDTNGNYVSAVRSSAQLEDSTSTSTTPVYKLKVTALSFGVWGDNIEVTTEADTRVYADGFNLVVKAYGQEVERFNHLTFDATTTDYVESKVSSNYITAQDLLTTGTLVHATKKLAGGNDGVASVTDADYETAINNFADAPISILVTPGVTSSAVIAAALTFAENRNDIIYVTDVPEGSKVADAVSFRSNNGVPYNSSFGAMYYPWATIKDPVNGIKKNIPPSGAVAGIYCRGDVWEAPAGVNRGVVQNVIGLERILDQADRDTLYDRGVNPIAAFLDAGAVVWGQKTLQLKPSALDRVNVRRLLSFIEKSIVTSSKTLVFEPNHKGTWARFIRMVTPFLQNLKDRGALYDFGIVCDETVNTATVIDNNQMIAQIYLKPTKTAEAIEIQFIVTPTGASFAEFIAA